MDYTAWAHWYDLIYSLAPSDDVDLYVRLAREASRRPRPTGQRDEARNTVLEFGAGTGRIAIPTALAGANVTAVDVQAEMLDRAGAKAHASGLIVIRNGRRLLPKDERRPKSPAPGAVELIQADMRTIDLGLTFPLVTIPSNTLLLATTKKDQLATLKHATAHLALNGLLVFDIFNPTPELLSDRSETPFLWGETTNPENGRTCRIYAINRFDTRRQLNRGAQIIEEVLDDPPLLRACSGREVERAKVEASGHAASLIELDILIRYLHPSEAHLLIESAGLTVTGLYGDFDLSPFMASSPRLVFTCTHRL